MLAAEAGALLAAISRGEPMTVSPERTAALEALRARGLVRWAPDPSGLRERLAELKVELAACKERLAVEGASPELAGRERGLRASVLELVDQLAASEGASELRELGAAGPYRDVRAAVTRVQLTHAGRTLLGDLSPRMLRVGSATVEEVETEMRSLRDIFRMRAERAAQIRDVLLPRARGAAGGAERSVAVGLAALPGEPKPIVEAFEAMRGAMRAVGTSDPACDAAAAEGLCLTLGRSQSPAPAEAGRAFGQLRSWVGSSHVTAGADDASDTALLLAWAPADRHPAMLAAARQLGEQAGAGPTLPLRLSLSLLATAGELEVSPATVASVRGAFGALGGELPPAECLDVSLLLSAVRADLLRQLDAFRTLRQYLSRFAPDGMSLAAAMLCWLSAEPAEILDDLRLASAALQRHRLAEGGAEAMALSIKLLLSVAVLRLGAEGDAEERLLLGPQGHPRLGALGLAGATAPLPLVITAVAAFHRPVLHAAVAFQSAHQPTHSAYVFGGGHRSSGWG